MPPSIEVNGHRYRHVTTWKHDFFAATGLYEGDRESVVVKIGRRRGLLGWPLDWLGCLLVRHEADLLTRLGDLDGIPRLMGVVDNCILVHAFIPGHSLRKGQRVDDDFFERLANLIHALHRRGIAHVDLEKRQNVLVGDDGRPYLLDFQISWPWPLGWMTQTWPGRWLGRRLQQGDRYHLLKLRRRFRPDQMTPEELAESYRRPWGVRAHTWLTRPFTKLRRRALARLDPGRYDGERGRTEQEPGAGSR
jgi:hypothetical protein